MSPCEPLVVPQKQGGAADYGFVPCDGGVCAAVGMRASGVAAGFRKEPGRRDLALVAADKSSVCAATFTQNRFCAAPVQVSRERVASGHARAVVLNSGNANASTGVPGLEVARESSALVAAALGCDPEEVLMASTGVIGAQLSLEPFRTGVPVAVAELEASARGAHHAARAVMTTDTVPKESSYEGVVETGDVGVPQITVHVGGFVKGSGMISPNMATMLSVISTDAPLTPAAAHAALLRAVKGSFNKVTVDSDTSTNDSCYLFATGCAGGPLIEEDSPAFAPVAAAIAAVCEDLAQKIAADGEGATNLVTVDVLGARNDEEAEVVARAIANSPLVKTAIAGHDANWGRVAGAAGKCGVEFDQYAVDIDFMGVPVLRAGLPVPMDEEDMLRRFEQPEISIVIALGCGDATARIWTCDLTHGYITINGDYRT
ncbi:MAG: bifunctional glutamate N-acetyltransferase/amino-acid acetyltransferase ArgJ [Coriobacteriales bacterium]|nr:bifunctional glutamate N-acetyltransferase/amino-acid acetyltransferase ArgJ [Coriobacteriales bacterium]